MSGVNTSQYAVQEIFNISIFDLETGACQAVLENLKSTNWMNNGQVVYAQGGRGNAKLIGFGHSKESKLECGSAVISDGSLAVQSGTDVATVTTSTAIQFMDIITVSSNAGASTYTATGTVGKEINFAYLVNDDGSLGKQFTQTTGTVAAGKFTYTAGTKALAFFAGEVTTGSKVVVFYYPTVSSAKKFTNKTDKFAKNVRVVADGRFRDVCTSKDYNAQLVFYKAKTSEEYSLSLSADGAPAVQNINFEALKQCGSTTLWDLFVYDSADLS